MNSYNHEKIFKLLRRYKNLNTKQKFSLILLTQLSLSATSIFGPNLLGEPKVFTDDEVKLIEKVGRKPLEYAAKIYVNKLNRAADELRNYLTSERSNSTDFNDSLNELLGYKVKAENHFFDLVKKTEPPCTEFFCNPLAKPEDIDKQYGESVMFDKSTDSNYGKSYVSMYYFSTNINANYNLQRFNIKALNEELINALKDIKDVREGSSSKYKEYQNANVDLGNIILERIYDHGYSKDYLENKDKEKLTAELSEFAKEQIKEYTTLVEFAADYDDLLDFLKHHKTFDKEKLTEKIDKVKAKSNSLSFNHTLDNLYDIYRQEEDHITLGKNTFINYFMVNLGEATHGSYEEGGGSKVVKAQERYEEYKNLREKYDAVKDYLKNNTISNIDTKDFEKKLKELNEAYEKIGSNINADLELRYKNVDSVTTEEKDEIASKVKDEIKEIGLSIGYVKEIVEAEKTKTRHGDKSTKEDYVYNILDNIFTDTKQTRDEYFKTAGIIDDKTYLAYASHFYNDKFITRYKDRIRNDTNALYNTWGILSNDKRKYKSNGTQVENKLNTLIIGQDFTPYNEDLYFGALFGYLDNKTLDSDLESKSYAFGLYLGNKGLFNTNFYLDTQAVIARTNLKSKEQKAHYFYNILAVEGGYEILLNDRLTLTPSFGFGLIYHRLYDRGVDLDYNVKLKNNKQFFANAGIDIAYKLHDNVFVNFAILQALNINKQAIFLDQQKFNLKQGNTKIQAGVTYKIKNFYLGLNYNNAFGSNYQEYGFMMNLQYRY